jgi:hypothetical protein
VSPVCQPLMPGCNMTLCVIFEIAVVTSFNSFLVTSFCVSRSGHSSGLRYVLLKNVLLDKLGSVCLVRGINSLSCPQCRFPMPAIFIPVLTHLLQMVKKCMSGRTACYVQNLEEAKREVHFPKQS